MTATMPAAAESRTQVEVFDATTLYHEIASMIDVLGGWNPSVIREILGHLDAGRPEHESELYEVSVIVVQVAGSTEHASREQVFFSNRLDPNWPLDNLVRVTN